MGYATVLAIGYALAGLSGVGRARILARLPDEVLHELADELNVRPRVPASPVPELANVLENDWEPRPAPYRPQLRCRWCHETEPRFLVRERPGLGTRSELVCDDVDACRDRMREHPLYAHLFTDPPRRPPLVRVSLPSRRTSLYI